MASKLQQDVKASLAGDASALERPQKGKQKQRSPEEVVASLSPKARAALRARAQSIIDAIDALDAESEGEPAEEEELI